MKTTIELPDDLAREAEATAALAGQSLPELVAHGLRLLLAHPELAHPPRTDAARPDPTAWDRLRAAYQDPFPSLTSLQTLDEMRGPVELPPAHP